MSLKVKSEGLSSLGRMRRRRGSAADQEKEDEDVVSLKSSYDEVTLNFGKPVLSSKDKISDNIFESISFGSPIEDLCPESREAVRKGSLIPPVPAPRSFKSSKPSEIYENFDIYVQNQENSKNDSSPPSSRIYEDIRSLRRISSPPPPPPPRNSILIPESSSILDHPIQQDARLSSLGARPKEGFALSKIGTLDIRNAVEKLYDEAEEELERDLSIDLSVLERPSTLPAASKAHTLLRDFDPVFEPGQNPRYPSSVYSAISEEEEDIKDPIKKGFSSPRDARKERENIYVDCPIKSSSIDFPPPTAPPPPLPRGSPPPPLPPNKPKYYENFIIGSRKPEDPTVKHRETQSQVKCEDLSSSTTSSSSSLDHEAIKKTVLQSPSESSHQPQQRSFSTANLNLSKMASQLRRKMSDQVLMRKADSTRRHNLLDPGYEKARTINNSGLLLMWSRSKKSFQSKWCVLSGGKLQYYNDKDSLAIPKEVISLTGLLCLNKLKKDSEEEDLYRFDLSYLTSSNKYCSKTFGARTYHDREVWLEKITQSLSYTLSNHSMSQSSRLGWAYMKEGFAGNWNPTWISLANRSLSYFTSPDQIWEVMDLRKTKDITLKKDVKYLDPPISNFSVLVVDFVDRSLYFVINSETEIFNWYLEIFSKAFSNGNTLVDQQMTLDEIPVIVDKCIKFVLTHGCMSEGIYRQSGVKTKIDSLLNEFKRNAWAVQISRNNYSEHDVANTIKRFLRTLEEPLLTEGLRSVWMEASCIKDIILRKRRYKELLRKLPDVNYNTLRKLTGHLSVISSQKDKNLMPDFNLASIWGPTLLTVDGQQAKDFARTSGESNVCRDLIEHYSELFDVKPEELEREQHITGVLKKINSSSERGQHGHLKRSGDLRMWVYVDTKTSGSYVCLVVQPSLTALEMTRRVLCEVKRGSEDNLFLHEMVMGGTLERPLHHSEIMLNVTLRWASWSNEDRMNNYLLLKKNTLYEQALPCALPPLSVYEEAHFGENKAKSKFYKHLFSMNNAKIISYREPKSGGAVVEQDSWPIEDIQWYIGVEEKRKAPFQYNITFIEKEHPVVRCKERPYFGHTISFEHVEVFVKWIAAMLVAEYPNDVSMPASLILLEDFERKAE